MTAMDMSRVERIRKAIVRCTQPFGAREIATLLGCHTKAEDRTIRNALEWLFHNGELERQYVKKARRRNALVFTTTAEFGQKKPDPDRIVAAMGRLDRVMRRSIRRRHPGSHP